MPNAETQALAPGRSYERTHPWLTFALDLGRLQHTDWLALGEATSMIDRIAEAPLAPAVAEDIHKLYLAKGALATTAIEGNTLSEEEARDVVDGTSALPPSREYLAREVDNIVAACDALVRDLGDNHGRIPLTVERIERMNAAVLRGLNVEDYVRPGTIRAANVSVGGYRCPDWQDARYLLARLCDTLDRFESPEGSRYAFSILKAIFAHVYLAWIHPFGDGNGRTARLVELAILLEAGLPQPACHLLSNHYNLTRTEYYRQLARASRRHDGVYGFASYAIAGLVDGLREQIEVIRQHQWNVAWIDFVHERFRGTEGVTARRQRALVLALSRKAGGVRVADLPDLNADLARQYAQVSGRTLHRDVEALLRRGLLERGPDGVTANRNLVLAFLPWRNDPPADGT